MASERSTPQEMKNYWDDKISWWASSSYEEKPRGPIERFMAGLRRSVHARAVIALDLLRPQLAGKSLVDIGCGNGHFAFECLEAGASHVIGIDISPEAIELAKKHAAERGFAQRSTFLVGRAGDENLPASDFVSGFGLIDWLGLDECMRLFRNIKGRRFVFSYSEADRSFDEIVHHFYLIERLKWFGGGVRAYHHKREEILRRVKEAQLGLVDVVVRKEMRFGRLLNNINK